MRYLLLLMVFTSFLANAKNCANSCRNYEQCSFIGVIEIERRSKDYMQAYDAKVIYVKEFDEVSLIDWVGDKGTVIGKTEAPEKMIVVEYGIRPIDSVTKKEEIIFTDHGDNYMYEVGKKYYYFGHNIKDNFYETSRNSCSMEIK